MQNQSISNKTKAVFCLFWLSCLGCEHTVNALVNQTKEFKMSALNGLKFVSAKRPQNVAPIVQRRNKLSNQLWEQMELARAFSEGKTYAPTRLRNVKDKLTGERKTIEAVKRVKQWTVRLVDAGSLPNTSWQQSYTAYTADSVTLPASPLSQCWDGISAG